MATPLHVAEALHPSTQAIGRSAVVCGSRFRSSSENVLVWSLTITLNRHPGSAFVIPAAAADRLTGRSAVRHDNGETRRRKGTVAPAVATTATPVTTPVPRRNPRRLNTPSLSSPAVAVRRARRTTGSLTATWITIDPMAI